MNLKLMFLPSTRLHILFVVFCSIIGLSSCASRNSNILKYEHRDIKELQIIPSSEYPLDPTLIESLDKKEYRLQNFVLIVKYDESDTDPRKQLANQEALFLERHLFGLLKRLNRDIEREYGLRINYDEILQDTNASTRDIDVEHNTDQDSKERIPPFNPEIFQWKLLEGSTHYNFLTTVWQSYQEYKRTDVGGLFSISISLIHEKEFFGYRLYVRFTSFNNEFFRPLTYSSEFVYSLR